MEEKKQGIITISGSRIFAGILVIVAIISSGYALANVWDFHVSYAFVFLSALMLLQARRIDERRYYNAFIIMLFFIAGVIFSFVLSGFSKFNTYFSQVFVCILAFEIVKKYNVRAIINCFVNVMFVIAIIGILFHVAVNTLNLSLPLVTGMHRVYGNAWLYVYINGRAVRNCGLFWEPCIFGSYLALALLLSNLENNNRQLVKTIVFIIAILTTNSSTGFALLALAILMIFLQKTVNGKRSALKKIVYGLAVILVVCGLVFWDQIINSFFANNTYVSKLLSDTISTSSRFEAIFANLGIFATKPLFGVGIQQFQNAISAFSFDADTATSVTMLSKYGILGISYTILIIKGAFNYGNDLLQKLILAIFILIIVNTIPHQTFLATWVIIFALNEQISKC